MKQFLISGLIILISLAATGQDEVNYKSKALLNELSKYTKEDYLGNIEELQINDTLLRKGFRKGKYYKFQDLKAGNPIKYIYVGRVNSCRAGGCSLSNTESNSGQNEYFDYFILFDKDVSVYKVKVFNYRATHGHEVTAPGWLKQFVGYSGHKNLDIGKNVDAISGATISVYGITADIESKTRCLRKIVLGARE